MLLAGSYVVARAEPQVIIDTIPDPLRARSTKAGRSGGSLTGFRQLGESKAEDISGRDSATGEARTPSLLAIHHELERSGLAPLERRMVINPPDRAVDLAMLSAGTRSARYPTAGRCAPGMRVRSCGAGLLWHTLSWGWRRSSNTWDCGSRCKNEMGRCGPKRHISQPLGRAPEAGDDDLHEPPYDPDEEWY